MRSTYQTEPIDWIEELATDWMPASWEYSHRIDAIETSILANSPYITIGQTRRETYLGW